jgi:(S)-sulfolactate dehydrogenase
MSDIVISEFMDQAAVDAAAADYEVVYDPNLVDRAGELAALLADTRALVCATAPESTPS